MNETILRQAGLGKQVDLVKDGKCPTCEKSVNYDEFDDELSKREYGISGMCQVCQDEVFADTPEYEEDSHG